MQFQNALIFRAFSDMLSPVSRGTSTHFLRFVQRGECEWSAILRVTSGTHQFSLDFLSKWLEMQLSARARGFESHRFRHQSLENSMFSRLFLLLGHHLFWGKQFKWCPWCPALWCPAHSTSYTPYKKDVYCGAPMVPGTAKKL